VVFPLFVFSLRKSQATILCMRPCSEKQQLHAEESEHLSSEATQLLCEIIVHAGGCGAVAARELQVHAATGAMKILQAGCMPQENKITKESINRPTFPPFFTRLTDSPYALRFLFFFFTSDHMRLARCIGALPFFFTSPTNCARAAAAAYQGRRYSMPQAAACTACCT
jgi:hypothetical protein